MFEAAFLNLTQFALIALSAALPRILLSPLAGVLVDRWDRRRTMLLSDLGAGLCTLGMAVLLFYGRLAAWHVLLGTGISAAFGAFQYPAYASSVVRFVPRQELGRANGLIQLSQAAADIFAPLLAGLLLTVVGTWGVLLIDFATFLCAVLTLAIVRFPGAVPGDTAADRTGSARPAQPPASPAALVQDAFAGWRWIASQPGLLGLLFFLGLFNFLWGMVGVLAQPMVLGFASPAALGALLSTAGGGLLLGSLAMSAWGGPKRRVAGILLFEFFSGLCFLLMGWRPSILLVALGAFGAHATIAVIGGCSQALWQSKTPAGIQGRVFATLQMVSNSARPLAFLIAGPLAERLFEPLLAGHGPLAASLGRLLGTGPGRGIALMFLLMGLAKIGVSATGALFPRLRRLEDELPDENLTPGPFPGREGVPSEPS